jgi:Kef-type K+ transport system membrane component KefB
MYVGIAFLDYTGGAAALIGAMWASHTLVAYTEVKSAGLESNRAVGAAVSATVITDVLALVILGFVASPDGPETTASAGDGHIALVPVGVGVVILAFFCLWLLPRATNWFFVTIGRTRVQRFVWVLGGMAAGAFVSLLGGIEGLVGAFLAGIGINRLVPAHGQLMERIEFFGAALFVPAFLISVGLSIDPGAIAQPSTIRLALLFSALVVVGKVLAAAISGKIFGFSWTEIGMMSSLTIGQAAATLAIAQVGISTGIFDQEIVNAAVMAVVITVVITSLGTRFFARGLKPPVEDFASIGNHVLLRVPGNEHTAGVIDIGVAITRKDNGLLTPFIVCDDGACGEGDEKLQHAVQAAIDRGQDSEGIARIAQSQVEGTLNLAAEAKASMLLLPWTGIRYRGKMSFGDAIDEIGERSPVPVIAARIVGDRWGRVVCFLGRSKGLDVREEDSNLALEIAHRVAEHEDLDFVVYATEPDEVADKDRFTAINLYTGRGGHGLSSIAAGDLVVVPFHVAEDAIGVGSLGLKRQLKESSLLIVGGPHRLHVSRELNRDRVLGGGALTRRDREPLAGAWEGDVR